MAGQMKLDTDQVTQIAQSIDGLNKQLFDTLTNSQTTINNLANTWEGQASEATITSYKEFANKYFQNYFDIIDQYVKFLHGNVVADYTDVETANKNLADAFL